MSEELCFRSATELALMIRRRDVSPVEVVEAFLDRIEHRNERINAYVTVIGEEAHKKAQKADQAVSYGKPLGLLHGVPVAIKDLSRLQGRTQDYIWLEADGQLRTRGKRCSHRAA